MNKPQLRKHIAGVLNGLSCAEKQKQSETLFKKLIEHPKYKQAKRVSLYLSTENEVDTRPILRYTLETTGKQCFIPFVLKQQNESHTSTPKIDDGGDNVNQCFVDKTTRMIMVELSSMRDYDELPVNHYGIKGFKEVTAAASIWAAEPNESDSDLDVVIVPGVAFSRDGRRLGHGKGYYDEFLTYWASNGRAPKRSYTIGLAFHEQLVDDPLAIEGHDYTLDEVLSPT